MRHIFAGESALIGRAKVPTIFVLVALMAMFLSGLQVASPAHAETTFTVNSTNDPGNGVCDATECTLREAITAANTNPGADTIHFNIPGNDPHTISPDSELPTITQAVTIDGYTQGKSTTDTAADDATENTIPAPQDGTNAVLKIELNGSNAGEGSNGLTISGSLVEVRGLVINRFEDAGIALVSVPTDFGPLTSIEGNFIGTNPAGDADMGNGGDGIEVNTLHRGFIGAVDGGMTYVRQLAARNLISGNGGDGISLGSDSNRVSTNLIGTTADGTAAVPNAGDGLLVDGDINAIGQPPSDLSTPHFGNVIAHNGGRGVAVIGGTGNRIFSNSIFSNGGLGIDLVGGDEATFGFGVTKNDKTDRDKGTNMLQNYPELRTATTDDTTTTITGKLKSTPRRYLTIQFFTSREVDPSGFGEGEEYLGWKTVKTNRRGRALFTFTVDQDLQGEFVTSTATGPGSNTSEFSAAIVVQ